ITSELIFRYYSEDSVSFNRQRMPRHNYFSSTGGSHNYKDVLEGFLDDIGIYSQDLETHDYRETSFLIACSVNGRKYGDTTISKVSEKKEFAGKMSLYQNYPNPFNPSTTISYYIPKEGFVRLKLYDNLGREINTLVEAFKPAGEHSFIFYAGSLPCGVYIYRIESQGFVDSKKLILIK
ncbi:MAG: T9SS type A sorting domain-containing protein, partial [Bacteroidota bacterium]|nr:T9SS type A sorting domain-containing protein [Bacteroidota bacterium]